MKEKCEKCDVYEQQGTSRYCAKCLGVFPALKDRPKKRFKVKMEFDCFDKKHGTEVLDYLFQRFSEEDARDVICGDGHIKVIEIEEGHSEEIEYKTAFRLWWEKQKEGNRKFVERVEKAKARKP